MGLDPYDRGQGHPNLVVVDRAHLSALPMGEKESRAVLRHVERKGSAALVPVDEGRGEVVVVRRKIHQPIGDQRQTGSL